MKFAMKFTKLPKPDTGAYLLLQSLIAGSITAREAILALDVTNPARLVRELRHRYGFGSEILTVWPDDCRGRGYASYRLTPAGRKRALAMVDAIGRAA